MVGGIRGHVIEADFVRAGGQMDEGLEMRLFHWPSGRRERVLGMDNRQSPVKGVAAGVPDLAVHQEYFLVDLKIE